VAEPSKLPFPPGISGSVDLPETNIDMLNFFNNGDGELIPIPGITQLNTTLGTARGNFVWNGSMYQVSADKLIKITDPDTGAFSTIGAIEGSEVIVSAEGNNETVIIVKGGKSYTLDAADVLVDTSGEANFVPFVDVLHQDGRFLYVAADGSLVKFSDVGDGGTIQPLSFFDAEERPDKLSGIFELRNTVGVMGTQSIEFFRDTGETPVPYVRLDGTRVDFGYIGGRQKYANTILFVGREQEQDYGIYELVSGGANKISNAKVDEIMDKYTLTELSEVITNRIKWQGYELATFTFRDDSLAYYRGEWNRLDTVFDGISRPWGGGFITQFNKKYYTAFSNLTGRFDKINTQYGNRITRLLQFPIRNPQSEYFALDMLELGISQGFNTAVKSVGLRMSRDNVQFGPTLFRETAALGKYFDKLQWEPPGGLGTYDGFCSVRLFTTEDVSFASDYMVGRFS